MFIKILISVAILVAGFLSYVAIKPSNMVITRELVIKAPPEKIFPYINNAKKADEWMPWKDSDPGVQMQYSGPEEGVGSKSSWDSKGQMGTGSALVVESIPNQSVKTQLTYTRPMEMSQMAHIMLTPTPEGTLVKWSVDGHNNFICRMMSVFMDMDKMVGDEFVKGLTKLKSITE